MELPPFVPILVVSPLLPLLPGTLRRLACVVAPLASLYVIAVMPDGTSQGISFLGQEIVLVRCDSLSRIFGLVFSLAATVANLYGWYRDRPSQQASALLYSGAALAVVFAGDLLSMLIAWELMAVMSALLVFGGKQPGSTAAAQRYLLVHLAAGSLMLFGIVGLLANGESIVFGDLGSGTWQSYALLAACCINAAVPPMHGWLPDAYPEADVAGGVFLSTFTTKAAVYCLVRGFAGEEVLIWAGALMAVYGVVFATMEDDMRRLLSYHIVSQVGYMVCGVGIGSALALNGAVAHAVCHILYKSLLFMAVGAITFRTGRRSLSELGGLLGVMPITFGLYMVGALSISGAPLFNGFISKSLVVSGAGEAHLALPVFLLTLASVGTFLSVGLKLPYFAWGPARTAIDARGEAPGEAPGTMLAAMGVLAACCLGLGIYPSALYDLLPRQPVSYDPYTAYHVIEAVLIMVFCGLAFHQGRARLLPHLGRTMDLDQIYRRPFRWLGTGLSPRLDGGSSNLGSYVDRARSALVSWVRDPTTWSSAADQSEKPAYDENVRRPTVATNLSLILGAFIVIAGLLLITGL